MILIDTNALVVLIIGFIDTRLFKNHKRTSIYEKQDFEELLTVIGSINNLVVLPNIWTEVDNLLNDFSGNYKYQYVEKLTETIRLTNEKFISSLMATQSHHFYDLGLTDSLVLEYAKECRLLITSDSKLSDYALAYGIPVYDIVKSRNDRL